MNSSLSGIEYLAATASTPIELYKSKSRAVAILDVTNLHYVVPSFDEDQRKIYCFLLLGQQPASYA